MAEREELVSAFASDIRARFLDKHLGLFTLLGCFFDKFIWRPGEQILYDYIQDESDFEYVSQIVGLELCDDARYLELAYYLGHFFCMFPQDRNLQVISTDHESTWLNADNRGTVEQFFEEFMTTEEIVHSLSDVTK